MFKFSFLMLNLLNDALAGALEVDGLRFCYFLCQSKDECEYLINLAKPNMKKSTVVDNETGKSKDSKWASLNTYACMCG